MRGLQKEAYFFEKRAAVLDNTTGWVELIESEWNILCGTDPERIQQAIRTALAPPDRERPDRIFGGGDAARKILERILAQ